MGIDIFILYGCQWWPSFYSPSSYDAEKVHSVVDIGCGSCWVGWGWGHVPSEILQLVNIPLKFWGRIKVSGKSKKLDTETQNIMQENTDYILVIIYRLYLLVKSTLHHILLTIYNITGAFYYTCCILDY